MRIVLMMAAVFWAVAYLITKETSFIIISSMFSCTLAIVAHSDIQNERN